MKKITSFGIAGAFCVVALVLILISCGSGKDDGLPVTSLEGFVLDKAGNPVNEAEIFIYETNESSVTDEQGAFSLESYRNLGTISIYLRTTLKAGQYTNRVDLGEFPAGALIVRPRLTLDTGQNELSLAAISFNDDLSSSPALPAEPTAAPGETPVPGATPTKKASPFDSNGNTTAFGIPAGLTGNITRGKNTWAAQCRSCHPLEKINRSYGQIKNSFRTQPSMVGLPTTNAQIADITAYLNRGKQ